MSREQASQHSGEGGIEGYIAEKTVRLVVVGRKHEWTSTTGWR